MYLSTPGTGWQRLHAWLFHPKETLVEFLIFRSALILFLKVPYFLFLGLLEQEFGLLTEQYQQLELAASAHDSWLSTVIIDPFLESLMILGLLKLGSWLRLRSWANCALCAFLMALLHVSEWGWLKPMPTFMSFTIFTSAYLAYYQRSRWLGFALCMGLHVLNNGFPEM